jgi:hypothetical protein
MACIQYSIDYFRTLLQYPLLTIWWYLFAPRVLLGVMMMVRPRSWYFLGLNSFAWNRIRLCLMTNNNRISDGTFPTRNQLSRTYQDLVPYVCIVNPIMSHYSILSFWSGRRRVEFLVKFCWSQELYISTGIPRHHATHFLTSSGSFGSSTRSVREQQLFEGHHESWWHRRIHPTTEFFLFADPPNPQGVLFGLVRRTNELVHRCSLRVLD